MELTLTIPKTSALTRRQFVAIPQDEYKLFLKFKKSISMPLRLTPLQKKRIGQSERELARGEYSTLDTLEYELLGNTHAKAGSKKSAKIPAKR